MDTLPDEMTGRHQRSRRDVAIEIDSEMQQALWHVLHERGGRHARL